MTTTAATLHVYRTATGMQHASDALRTKGATLGLVPTMGALHEGHLSLIRRARQQCDAVAVSIFVNPLQFGPTEDFSRYPRTWEADVEKLQAEQVDMLFAPDATEMYPGSSTIIVDPGELGSRLDGASRPGHFRGVATIVAKLFHIIGPQFAYFGQKDAAQVAVLRAMVADLNFPLQLVVCPTVREPDGLAMSSRNRYLSSDQRMHALQLVHALRTTEQEALRGEHNAHQLQAALRRTLEANPNLRVDYAEVVSPDTLLPVDNVNQGALLAAAAWLGETRLIDNVVLPGGMQ